MLTGDPPWKEQKLASIVQLHMMLSTWEGIPPCQAELTDDLRACMELCFRKNPDERLNAPTLLKCAFLRYLSVPSLSLRSYSCHNM